MRTQSFRIRNVIPSFRAIFSVACLGLVLLSGVVAQTSLAAGDAAAFIGNWALTIPGGAAGWLGIVEKDGQLQGSILWGGGSVVPVDSVRVEDGELIVTRIRQVKRKDKSGKRITASITATITGRISGDKIELTLSTKNEKGKQVGKAAAFSGKRIPPVPAAPDLSKVKFGAPIVLFNGKDLSGWAIMNPDRPSSWIVQDGVMMNKAPQEEGKPHTRYSNIRTEHEFEDFHLTLETRVPENGNSGIYLRGIYEIQVADTKGRPLDSHNMGGIYSRICPTEAAEKSAGQWQTLDIMLIDRHVTVILNGRKIIDNQPLLGCTGGALWSDEFRPGPIYLQGDHSSVDYRNVVIRPVVK